MVKLHIKKGDDSLFLYECLADTNVHDVLNDILIIYNGRLKVERLCAEIDDLAKHGITLPPNMQGLTDEQISELKLVDEWADKCIPSGGPIENTDKIGRRNGKAPSEKLREMMMQTTKEAKEKISNKNVKVTERVVREALDLLRGAVTIVYPMGLPPHDPVQMELENKEELEGTQASLDILDYNTISIWFSGKEMDRAKKLKDYVGANDKTKVIAKIQKKGQGQPGREPVVSAEEQKKMMAYYYRKQEEMKKLDKDDDDSHLNSQWADSGQLRRQFHGLGSDISWKPR